MGRRYSNPKKQFVVHPDMIKAYIEYNGSDDSFQKVFDERDRLLGEGKQCHNSDHDAEMLETARERTARAAMSGHKYPRRKKSLLKKIFGR